MRVVESFIAAPFTVTIFSINDKYLIKMEYGAYEQNFKIPTSELPEGTASIRKMLSTEFIELTKKRFSLMAQQVNEAFQQLK